MDFRASCVRRLAVRVFEWGPEEGEPVLLLHGISTPAVALGDLAHDLVTRGVSNIPCSLILPF